MCATLSANGMAGFVIPKGVKRLVIIGDNYRSSTGQKALHALKIKALKQRLEVRTWIPPNTDTDALDHLNALKGMQP